MDSKQAEKVVLDAAAGGIYVIRRADELDEAVNTLTHLEMALLFILADNTTRMGLAYIMQQKCSTAFYELVGDSIPKLEHLMAHGPMASEVPHRVKMSGDEMRNAPANEDDEPIDDEPGEYASYVVQLCAASKQGPRLFVASVSDDSARAAVERASKIINRRVGVVLDGFTIVNAAVPRCISSQRGPVVIREIPCVFFTAEGEVNGHAI